VTALSLRSSFINFFSGAGRLYSTLREPILRRVTLDGQLFDPEDPSASIFNILLPQLWPGAPSNYFN